jgi:HPt (histidine-containing phosphotransfer) domain-containing protein
MKAETVIRIVVDPDLAELIPMYVHRRHVDLAKTRDALAAGDLETIRITGHSMKGSGGGYGFDGISEIGARMEAAGNEADAAAATAAIADLADYLDRLEVVYV